MRNIFITSLLFLGAIGGVYLLRDKMSLTGVPDAQTFAASQPAPKKEFTTKGVKNESHRNGKHVATTRSRQKHSVQRREADPGSFEPDQTVPGIYSQASDERAVEDSEPRANEDTSKPTATQKVALGVPVGAWVKSRQNQLPMSRPVADSGGGMRLLLWCMEMKKKGPEYLGDKECEHLLAQNQENALKTTY